MQRALLSRRKNCGQFFALANFFMQFAFCGIFLSGHGLPSAAEVAYDHDGMPVSAHLDRERVQNKREKPTGENVRKAGIFFAIAIILTAAQGISLSATNRFAGGKDVVALQDTPKVELYITSWCPYCRKAMDFFQARGIPFVAYDIEKDENAALKKNRLDSRRGVPFAVINGKQIHGFSEEAYLKALNGN